MVCLSESIVNWTYLCSAAQFVLGERTENYRSDTDELLIDAKGNSMISKEDIAVALLDETESPKHHRERFTVAY